MNYMPEVLELLGVEVNEKFNIQELVMNPYYFDNDYLLINSKGNVAEFAIIVEVMRGVYTIEKLPWKPKADEVYYMVCGNEDIMQCRWSSKNTNHFYRYNAGNCFKTKKEITPEIKERILQEMKGKYEGE